MIVEGIERAARSGDDVAAHFVAGLSLRKPAVRRKKV
jgi:hypothetical protein